MAISFKKLTNPATTAITMADALRHLRLIITDDDIATVEATEIAYVTGLIKAAEGYCESYCRRNFVPKDWACYLDAFPIDGILLIQKSPVISVTEVKYFDASGSEQTLDAANYEVDLVSEPARIRFKNVPTIADKLNAISIKFSAGLAGTGGTYDNTLLPLTVKSAMLLIVGHLYEHREEVVVGVTQNEIDFGVDRLLDTERLFMF